MLITEVSIIPIKPSDGLVAFASCVLDGQLYLGSIGVHTRLDGVGYRLTYPTKWVGSRQLNYYYPVTKEAGTAIEKAITEKCIEIFERSGEQHGRYNKVAHTD